MRSFSFFLLIVATLAFVGLISVALELPENEEERGSSRKSQCVQVCTGLTKAEKTACRRLFVDCVHCRGKCSREYGECRSSGHKEKNNENGNGNRHGNGHGNGHGHGHDNDDDDSNNGNGNGNGNVHDICRAEKAACVSTCGQAPPPPPAPAPAPAPAPGCNANILQAAITQQIISSADPPTLTVELVTISANPYNLQVTGLTFPDGFILESIATTGCGLVDGTTKMKCRHTVVLLATTATSGTGQYVMSFNAIAGPNSGCANSVSSQGFSLQTSNWVITTETDPDPNCTPKILAAAITQEIIGSSDPTTLTVELVTISADPFSLDAIPNGLSFPSGFILVSYQTTGCGLVDGTTKMRCRHTAVLEATTAISGTGDYVMGFNAIAVVGPNSLCPNSEVSQGFTLHTSIFV
jgi:hypothetical protein